MQKESNAHKWLLQELLVLKKKFWGERQRLHYLFIEIEMN